MSTKSKRKCQLEGAREAKLQKRANSTHIPADSQDEIPIPTFSDYESEEDVTYDPNNDQLDEEQAIFVHAKEWVQCLHRDDVMSLTLLLHHLLVSRMHIQVLNASKLIGEMVEKSDRTVREWRATFLTNDNSFPDTLQGKYQRRGVLWSDEKLNETVRKYVRQNANVKGKANMTSVSFCKWVNEEFLPNQVLEPGYPRKIGLETARKWLHHLEFHVLDQKKGVYIDGHEGDDVIEYRQKFLRKIVSIGFLNKDNAPTVEAAQFLPDDLECPSPHQLERTVVIFHDESIFTANEDQKLQWGSADMHVIRPKGKGAGIMVSDFIDEFNGYLRLTNEELERAKVKYGANFQKEARMLLEYGESKEGYWTSDKFLSQMDHAVKIAEIKYPKEIGYRLIWIFDNSSCHNAYADDALNASLMNAKPGGKQPRMRDTVWNGKAQRMVFNIGIPKGLIQVLTERGKYNKSMKLDDMRKKISFHTDFKEEKTKLEHFLNDRSHVCIMLPKFHCKLNPIERCWGKAKLYTKAYTNYMFPRLRSNIPSGLDTVSKENIENFFRKARNYMFGYLEGFVAGPELEKQIKKYKKQYKSHRKVGVDD